MSVAALNNAVGLALDVIWLQDECVELERLGRRMRTATDRFSRLESEGALSSSDVRALRRSLRATLDHLVAISRFLQSRRGDSKPLAQGERDHLQALRVNAKQLVVRVDALLDAKEATP